MRKFAIAALAASTMVAAVVLLVVGVAPRFSGAADHVDAPLVTADGRIDINDVYAFHPGDPQDIDTTVLVMTVNPFAGAVSGTTLRPGARYEFLIDTDGDAVQDIAYRMKFSGGEIQKVHLKKAVGKKALKGGGGDKIAKGRVEETILLEDGGSLFVGLRDDPFFFDLLAFLGADGRTFCDGGEVDFFADANVTAIVLEMPTADLGPSDDIGVWARVVKGKQVERMGRPVINTVLIPTGSKDAFNATEPADDVATWTTDVAASLTGLGGGSGLAGVLLPDILTTDTSVDTGFLNGRNLDDDVIDASLDLVTGGGLTTDCVDANDVSFLTTFPDLAEPHMP
ncbi:MAG: DUF4331 family protein [Dehalococcoidia bacterium]